MSTPAWVIDTNVLVSAILSPGGNCDKILQAAIEGRIRLAWSAQMLAEYRMVLLRPKFGLSVPVVSGILAACQPSDQVSASFSPSLPDPDDEIFLAAALVIADRILVTGNTAHFPEKICAPVRILRPAQAAKLLASI